MKQLAEGAEAPADYQIGAEVDWPTNLPAFHAAPAPPVEFQARVAPWMQECFGPVIAADRLERGDRFLEESLELLQSGGYPKDRIRALVEYVYGRPEGEPAQEVGGVMVTLAAYCQASGLNMHEAGETELARIQRPEIIARIRDKQAAKARDIPFSPLPGIASHSALPAAQEAVPDQPTVMVGEVRRFRANVLVRHLLDHGGLDMNALAFVDAPREDRVQFAQLIGYSVSGWGTLSYVEDDDWDRVNVPPRLDSAALSPQEVDELERLRALVNSPELHDFSRGVVLEAGHQRERWGNEHDAGKEPADWFWLVGYLAGKALNAHKDGNTEKALHHTVTTAAALANWHGAILGTTNMRPGIDGEAVLPTAVNGDEA